MDENNSNPVLDEDETPMSEELSQSIDSTVADVFEMEAPAKEETAPETEATEETADAEASEAEETKEPEAEETKAEESGIPVPPKELLQGLAGKRSEVSGVRSEDETSNNETKTPPAEEKPKEEPQIPVHQPRNFAAEFLELAQMYPELQGKTIPNEVFKKASQTEHSVLACYNEYLIAQQKTELEQLRREVKQLRQNEENARRAPVKPSGEHPAQPGKSDPFMDAWNSLN